MVVLKVKKKEKTANTNEPSAKPNKKRTIKLKIKKKPGFKANDLVKVRLTPEKEVRAKVTKTNGDYIYVKYLDKTIQEEFGNNEVPFKNNKVRKTNSPNKSNNNQPNNQPNNNQPNNKPNNKQPNNKTNNKSNKIVIPQNEWVLPNKKDFPKWINETFIKYQMTNNNNTNNNNNKPFDLRKTQKFIRDYLQLNSPYRGILLYHGLGSGKTCSSIAVAENLINNKNVIVMLPASLRSNYIKALQSKCGNKAYKANPKLIKDRYTFVSYNASNAVDQLKRIGSLDNHVIIVDEIHNLISMMTGNSKQGPEIYNMLMEAKNVKLVFLSGTPIINIPFETAKLFNLLRGYIEVHMFAIRYVGHQYGATWKLDTLEDKLRTAVEELDYIEFNTVGRNLGLTLRIKSYDPGFESVIAKIIDIAAANDVTIEYMKPVKKITLFPELREEFDEYFVDDVTDPKMEMMKNKELYLRRILGLVSYYRGASEKYYPKVNEPNLIYVPMSNYQFAEYESVRAIERQIEKGSSKSKPSKTKGQRVKALEKKKVTSVFRTFSRQYSNFVFPETIQRPFKTKLMAQRKKKKNNNNNNNAQEEKKGTFKNLESAEEIANSDRALTKSEKEKIDAALVQLHAARNTVLKDLGPNEGLAIYSPKMLAMLNNLNASEGLSLVYSTYRTLEGVEIFGRVLETNGYKRFSMTKTNNRNNRNNGEKPVFAIWSGQEDEKEREEILKIYNSYENRDGALIKVLMITAAGAEGLDLKNVRQVHIMEPFWHEIRIDQVIGRAVRLNSHTDLPPKDRVVDIYRYFSVMTDEQKAESPEKTTTDEHIYETALKKLTIINDIKMLMKEGAVDCQLNAKDNEKNIRCFSFAKGETGIASKPEISKNAIYVLGNSGRKSVQQKLDLMFMDGNKRVYVANKKDKKLYYYHNHEKTEGLTTMPKGLKKIAVNKNTNEVYNYNAAKQKNPVKIGDINGKGVIV